MNTDKVLPLNKEQILKHVYYNPVGWTDDQMIRFGSYIISPSLSEFSYEERLEIFRQHEERYGIEAPVKSKDE